MDAVEMKSRRMTICQGPTLRLQGRWLERAGFVPGTKVRIAVAKDRLVLEAIDPVAEEDAAIQAQIHSLSEIARQKGDIAAAANVWYASPPPSRRRTETPPAVHDGAQPNPTASSLHS